jgi:beta-lactam-binding protein with PASTA domain
VTLGEPSWPAVALGVACGVLFGALIALVLGPNGDDAAPLRAQTVTISRTVTVAPGPTTTPGTVIVRTLVPDLAGERLDIAKRRLQVRGFEVDVDGGGILGVIRDRNWRVTEQRPAAGTYLEQGSSVRLKVEK